MKRLDGIKSFVFAIMIIPTTSTIDWKSEKYSSIPKNEVSTSDKGLFVKVDSSAGPLIFPLKSKITIYGFKVTGEFLGLPALADPKFQGQKGFDDYPLRIGFVVPGEKKLSGFKKLLAPQWVKRVYEQAPEGTGVDSIRFFNVTQNSSQLRQTRIHPSTDLIHEDFFAVVSKAGPFDFDISFKQPIESIAIWISIDGDDTKSKFDVLISRIELKLE